MQLELRPIKKLLPGEESPVFENNISDNVLIYLKNASDTALIYNLLTNGQNNTTTKDSTNLNWCSHSFSLLYTQYITLMQMDTVCYVSGTLKSISCLHQMIYYLSVKTAKLVSHHFVVPAVLEPRRRRCVL